MSVGKGDYWSEVLDAETMEPIGVKILAGDREQEEKQLAGIARMSGIPRDRLTLLSRTNHSLEE